MPIFGTALLALCLLTGLGLGRLIGAALGLDADIGGVGLAMILLIVLGDGLKRRGLFLGPEESRVTYWGQMYVPIVVAMAASQNVRGAIGGGAVALFAGLLVVLLSFGLVGLLAKSKGNSEDPS